MEFIMYLSTSILEFILNWTRIDDTLLVVVLLEGWMRDEMLYRYCSSLNFVKMSISSYVLLQ